jgi:hypothetical protein
VPTLRVILFVAVAMFASGSSARAQLVIGTDVTFATRSVWRGLTRVSDPVLQPSGYVALRVGSAFVTAGIWADYEFGNTEAGDHSLAGIGQAGFGAVEGWVEYAARQSIADWRVGYVHARFRNESRVGGIPAELSTGEIYAGLRSRHLPVIIAVTGWQDIDEVDGRYFELDVAYPLPTNPLGTVVGSIFVGGRAGFVHGQEQNDERSASPYYFDTGGFSHVDLYAEWGFDIPVSWLPLELFLSLHHEFAIDDATRRSGPAMTAAARDRFWWFEAAGSIGIGIGRGREQ